MRKAKTVPLSSKMLGPDDDEEDSKVVDIIKKYFIETSIHGPKYIFENKRHSCERLFWVFAVSIMASFGFYLIYQVNPPTKKLSNHVEVISQQKAQTQWGLSTYIKIRNSTGRLFSAKSN